MSELSIIIPCYNEEKNLINLVNEIKFIHSANGGVQITNFKTSKYYIQRYVKTKRLDYGGY